jgi:hemerythrin-like domain-containing protein
MPALSSDLFRAVTWARPEQVWSVLTATGVPLPYLYGMTIESDWRLASAVTMTLGGQWHLSGEILVAEPFRRLSYSLGERPGEPSVYVSWELRAEGGLTYLRLYVDEIDASDGGEHQLEAAWLPVLCGLASQALQPEDPSEEPQPEGESMSTTGNPYADTRDMYVVHAAFRREFALLPALVRGVAAGEADRARIVADHIELLVEFLHEHHSGEDAVLWPRLLARAPKEVDPVIHLVESHHENIEALSGQVEVLLKTWGDGAAGADREELATVLERLTVALYEHMGLEEKLILPLAERHIFASEWQQMVAEGAATLPPERVPVLLGMVMYEGGADTLPPDVVAALGEVAPQAYAAYAERVHGTATPPRSTDVGIGRALVGLA